MNRVLPLLFAGILPGLAQGVISEPLGFNKVVCLNNSDTIVGVPFRAQGSLTTMTAADPVADGDSATLTLTATNLAAGELAGHYIKFNSGAKDGFWYDVTANTTDSVTINLNGDHLTGVVAGDALVIAEYWTLNSLFPPARATTTWTEEPTGSGNWVQNGHAIVASATASQTTRQTEILLPDSAGTGTDRLSRDLFYLTGGVWRKAGVAGNFGTLILAPDGFITIRHRSIVARPTVLRSVGEVEAGTFTIPLATRPFASGSEKQDTYIAIPRPVDLRLDQLNLVGSGAFVASATASLTTRRDELLVYDNNSQLLNKIPTVLYYFTNGNWRKAGDPSLQNGAVIPAGAGFTIRKYPTAAGTTMFWPLPAFN